MISDEKLLFLGKKGFLVGPQEDERNFLKRIEFLQNPLEKIFEKRAESPPISLKNPLHHYDWDWAKLILKYRFDLSIDWVSAYVSKEKLLPWQAGMTWIFEDSKNRHSWSFIQIRKKSKKDEIIAHELVHAARMSFEEPVYEEMFAYLTSKWKLRRMFGPLIEKQREPWVFFILFFLGLWGELFSGLSFFRIFLSSSFLYAGAGFLRLFKKRYRFKKASVHLNELFNDRKKTLGVLLRLTDEEINFFARTSPEKIYEYAKKRKDNHLRWRQIFLTYFGCFKKK